VSARHERSRERAPWDKGHAAVTTPGDEVEVAGPVTAFQSRGHEREPQPPEKSKAQTGKKEKSKAPTLCKQRKGWGTLKFHFKIKCNGKATANHRGVNYRSGIIAPAMQSIGRNTNSKVRATRHPQIPLQRQMQE